MLKKFISGTYNGLCATFLAAAFVAGHPAAVNKRAAPSHASHKHKAAHDGVSPSAAKWPVSWHVSQASKVTAGGASPYGQLVTMGSRGNSNYMPMLEYFYRPPPQNTVATPKSQAKRQDLNTHTALGALATAAHDTGVSFWFLKEVARSENNFNTRRPGRNWRGDVVSLGLMQITPPTLFGILDDHSEQMQAWLSKPQYGDRFQAVLEWMRGDRSPTKFKAVLKKMNDPLLSAEAGALYLKDRGANGRNPSRAYLGYVSPQMAQIVFREYAADPNSDKTALQIARENGVPTDVIANNPAIFGPVTRDEGGAMVDGSWTSRKIIEHNEHRFSHVMTAAYRPHGHHRTPRVVADFNN